MGKVDCLAVTWGSCFFNSSDHRPPHFHVEHKADDWEIRVKIETTTNDKLDYNFKFPSNRKTPIKSSLEKEIREMVVKNRESLLKEWELKVTPKDK